MKRSFNPAGQDLELAFIVLSIIRMIIVIAVGTFR